jgi:hypothetical protein
MMLAALYTHHQYVHFVRNRARQYGGLRPDHRDYGVWRKLEATNLDGAAAQLAPLYDQDRGRPARDPVTMLRSCLAMLLCGETSFDAWVKQMRDEAFYALLSESVSEIEHGSATARWRSFFAPCGEEKRGRRPKTGVTAGPRRKIGGMTARLRQGAAPARPVGSD